MISVHDWEVPDVDTEELLSFNEPGDDVELGELKLCGQSCIKPMFTKDKIKITLHNVLKVKSIYIYIYMAFGKVHKK